MIDLVDSVTKKLRVASDSPIRRRFTSAERSYAVMLTKDLFGDWVSMGVVALKN